MSAKVGDVAKRGWLYKKSPGKTLLTSWKHRYFVLKHGVIPRLEYFETANDTRAINVIPLEGSSAREAARNEKDLSAGRYVFEVTPASGCARTYILYAETDTERQDWIKFINELIAAANKLTLPKASELMPLVSVGSVECPLVHADSDVTALRTILQTMAELQDALHNEALAIGVSEAACSSQPDLPLVSESDASNGRAILSQLKSNFATIHMEAANLLKTAAPPTFAN